MGVYYVFYDNSMGSRVLRSAGFSYNYENTKMGPKPHLVLLRISSLNISIVYRGYYQSYEYATFTILINVHQFVNYDCM